VAVLILQQLASGHYMVFLGPGKDQDRFFYLFHEPLGVLILVLLVARLGWRLTNPAPALPSTMPRWQVGASHASHTGLYITMAVMVSSAWLMASYASFPGSPNAPWILPNFTEKNLDYGRWTFNVHVWTGWTILGLVTVHAAAAIKHHVVDKDDVLRRMTPKWAHNWITLK
jgi:cytochrome b561